MSSRDQGPVRCRERPRLRAMIRRIDLRGHAPADYRRVVPRADFDVEAALAVGPADLRGRPRPRRRGGARVHRRASTACDSAAIAGAGARRSRTRSPPSTRPSGPRWRRPMRRARGAPRGRSSQADVVTEVAPGRAGHRALGPGRPGRPLRAGRPGGLPVSSVVMNVVPAQVAGVGSIAVASRRSRRTAACRTRRSWPRARCSASTRCTRSAARRRSRCSPTAPRPARRST